MHIYMLNQVQTDIYFRQLYHIFQHGKLGVTNLAKFSSRLLVISQKKFNFAWLQKKELNLNIFLKNYEHT